MQYKNITPAVFISRPNRFVAQVLLNGQVIAVHVKNTGRCRELLVPGAKVYLTAPGTPTRKLKYDLVAVEKVCSKGKTLMINMDSQAPNQVALDWLKNCGRFSPNANYRREVTFGTSRFDIYVEDGKRKAFVEVKGVTLERDGVAMFPDAPTERGIKHICELVSCVDAEYEAYILFVIQMKGICKFTPNIETHAAFAAALKEAAGRGVSVIACDCTVTPDSLEIDLPVKIEL